MKQVWSIAKYTLKENISNRIFNGFIFFGLFIMFLTVALKEIALYEDIRVIRDTGLFLIEFFMLLITVYTSSTQFLKEKKEKSIYLVLTKPVSRGMYVTGRVLGIMVTVFVNIAMMGLVLMLVLISQKAQIDNGYFLSLLLMFYKISILASIGVLFSVVSDSYVTSNIFTFSIYVIAHATYELKLLINMLETPAYKIFAEVLYRVMPNFRVLNYKDFLKNTDINLWQISAYSLGYFMIVLTITGLIFYKKKL